MGAWVGIVVGLGEEAEGLGAQPVMPARVMRREVGRRGVMQTCLYVGVGVGIEGGLKAWGLLEEGSAVDVMVGLDVLAGCID